MQDELRRELIRFRDLTARMSSSTAGDLSPDVVALVQELSSMAEAKRIPLTYPSGISAYTVIAALVFDLEVLGKSDGANALFVEYRQRSSRAH